MLLLTEAEVENVDQKEEDAREEDAEVKIELCDF